MASTPQAVSLALPGYRRFFYLSLPLLVAALVAWGFAPSYYLPLLNGTLTLAPIRHVHGAVFTVWVVFFVFQTCLVAANRRRLHMAVGTTGVALAGLMLVLGVWLTFVALGEGIAAGRALEAQRFIVLPLVDMLLFAVFVGAAVRFGRRAEIHKRCMVLATLALMPAALFRISIPFYGLSHWPTTLTLAAIVLAAAAFDLRTRGSVHPVYWLGGTVLVLSLPLRMMLAGTDAWMAIAGALSRLVA